MRRKTSIALAALIMACSVTGCQGAVSTITRNVIENNQADSAAAVPETPESTETETETELSSEEQEEQEQELYNSYIEVNNFMLGRLSDSLERYFIYVDIEQEEFALLDADDDYYDCYSLSEYDIEEARNAYALADGKRAILSVLECLLKLQQSITSLNIVM